MIGDVGSKGERINVRCCCNPDTVIGTAVLGFNSAHQPREVVAEGSDEVVEVAFDSHAMRADALTDFVAGDEIVSGRGGKKSWRKK